jgi:hypothetical protein
MPEIVRKAGFLPVNVPSLFFPFAEVAMAIPALSKGDFYLC